MNNEAREKFAKEIIECYTSLLDAANSAGGRISIEFLEKPLYAAITVLAPNKIRFIHKKERTQEGE